jgi:glycosyltransferase involved in cell wall biosynthesis
MIIPKITIFVCMRIAITGTRGIPNRYGGFEQFAAQLSVRLTERGHEVWVYNPAGHPYRGNNFHKVNIIRKPFPEHLLGPAANYIYDYICIKDAIRKNAGIILECGYASAVPAYRFLDFKNSKVITHLDGFEWQRPKWSRPTRKIIKRAEKTTTRFSHTIVCDHPEIQSYFEQKYSIKPWCIPFGADIFKDPDIKMIEQYNVYPYEYYLVIARLEPENNLQTIINGFLKTGCKEKLLIAGDPDTSFGRKLYNEYRTLDNIIFLNGIYDQIILDNLRHFSKAYFHGHSVGGTNPSLLEAMAAGSLIIAHDNKFNRYILKDNALYFNSEDDIRSVLESFQDLSGHKEKMVSNNIRTIEESYQWEEITGRYEELFCRVSGISLRT